MTFFFPKTSSAWNLPDLLYVKPKQKRFSPRPSEALTIPIRCLMNNNTHYRKRTSLQQGREVQRKRGG